MTNENRHASLLVLSSRVRGNILLAWITTGLIAIVLFTHKPPLSNTDLYQSSYDRKFSFELVENFKNDISAAFKEHFDSLDYDWVPSANAFTSSKSDTDSSDYLYEYLNIPGDRRNKHIDIVFSSSKETEKAFNRYLEGRKNRWQAFEIPVLSIRVARDEASFYLAIIGAIVQIMMLAKLEHLRRIEISNQSDFFIDPSLFSASFKNLSTFPLSFRVPLFILQSASRYCPPIANMLLTGVYLKTITNWNIADYTRLSTGFGCSVFTSLISVVYLIYILQSKPNRNSLFTN